MTLKHRHHALTYGGHDSGVCGKGFNALVLWALGYPDQAAARAAVEKVDNIKLVWWRPELLQLRGELQRSAPNGDRAAAESSYLVPTIADA